MKTLQETLLLRFDNKTRKISWNQLLSNIPFRFRYFLIILRSFNGRVFMKKKENYSNAIQRFFRKTSVKLTFYWRTFLWIDLTEKTLRGSSEFLVFPHCAVCNFFRKNFVKSTLFITNDVFTNFLSSERKFFTRKSVRQNSNIESCIYCSNVVVLLALISRHFCQKANFRNFHTTYINS